MEKIVTNNALNIEKVGKYSPAKRDSNLELFRIITMILIIAHHYVVNSGLTSEILYKYPLSGGSVFLFLFGAWGKIGINCFILITGYFMCKSNITMKKFVKLLAEVIFYSIVIYLIFVFTGVQEFSIIETVKVLIPTTTVATNFTGTFLLFYLCIPFLNILINNLTEKQHIYLLLTSSLIYILFGTVPFFSVTMNYVSWYIVLYFISSYIRLYPKKIFNSKKLWGTLSCVSILLSVISVIACLWLGDKINRNIAYAFVTDSNTFLAVTTGISTFLYFKNIKIKYNKLINICGASTFGVLQIHANSDTMRQWLWRDILDNVGMYSSAWMPVHAIGSIIGIFIICTIIDYMRIKLIETPLLEVLDNKFEKLSTWYKEKEVKICEKLNISQ